MNLTERTLEYLQKRRNKILEGGINSVPSPFKRFSNDFIGVEQGKYYVCTAGTKGGKTQLASYLFIYNPLLYAYQHPEQMRIKIFYYPLEETPEDIMKRFMSHLLYRFSNRKIRISTTDLQSSRNEYPIEEIWNMDNALAQLIVPRLQAFKELDKHGCPPDFDDMRKWNNTIQKMADAFELMKYVHTLSGEEEKTVSKGLELFCKYYRNFCD